MTTAFQVHVDPRGDFWVADGTVIDKGTGAIFPVGDGDAAGGGLTGEPAPNMGTTAEVPSVLDLVLVGGSGANVIVSGLGALDGMYRPGRPGFWIRNNFVLEVTGSSAATISDETDVIAALTTGGAAPAGSYVATTYGEDTYNASAAFTLTVVTEMGWPGGLVDLDVSISEGTAVGGSYVATDAVNFECAADADWTVVLAADGSSELIYDGTAVAVRAAGPPDDPCGSYVANDAGKLLNPYFPDVEETVPGDVNPFGTLVLVFSWPAAPDLDIGVTFLEATVGFGYASSADYMTWTGDDTGPSGSETVTIDLAAAWDAGVISTFADVLGFADWYPSHGGSGPATLEVTYAGGSPVTYALHPGSTDTPAQTPAVALRILADGTAEPVGDDWTATVRAVRRPPVAGVVYIEVTETAGVVTAVAGPFFAAAMSSPSGGMVPFPLATSDGAGKLKQLHTGPLVW